MDVGHELKMNRSHKEIRILLLHEFRHGRKATRVTDNICSAMSKDVLAIHTVQHWFNRFRNCNLELYNLACSDRPNRAQCRSPKAAYRRRFSINFMLFSRAAWMLPYCVKKHLKELGRLWRYEL